ncbi:MAG: response regulator [Myxococcales bacterium]|nr:response regulator [Myxococcales bacterium]
MLQGVMNFIDRSVPVDRIAEPDDRRRGRVLVAGSVVLTALGIVFFLNTLRLPSSKPINFIGVGGITLVFAAVPFVLRASGNVRNAGMWAVGWATLLLAGLVSSGGLRAPALGWLVFLPLLAHFFVSRAFAIGVLVFSIGVTSVAYWLTQRGHQFPMAYDGDQLAQLRWLSASLIGVFAMAVAVVYDDARQRALILQQEINERLRETNVHLAHARDEAEATNRAKSTFLATVSHELRTPLHGILAMTGTLADQPLSDDAHEQVAIADRSARSLNALIGDLLRLSEIEAGALKLEPAPWRIRESVADLKQIFLPQAESKKLTLSFSVADDVPSAVMLDSLRVQQVWGNLLANAVKFTDEGGVQFDIQWADERKSADNSGSNLVISVTDSGPGVAAEHQEQIFTPFMRADSSATRKYGGTGLGLAISRRLMDHMNGTVKITSELGKGSVFRVEIPTHAVAPVDIVRSELTESSPTPQQSRVLVADDSPICQEVLSQLLPALGYEATMVSDGQAALDALQHQEFQAVLMDCEMPVLDGMSAVRELRVREGSGARVPVIAVTAHSLSDQRDACLDAGMDDMLEKPFRLDALQEMLSRWVDRSTEESTMS